MNQIVHKFIADGLASYNLYVVMDDLGALLAIEGQYVGAWADDAANNRLSDGLNLLLKNILRDARREQTARDIRDRLRTAHPDNKYQDQLLTAIADAQDRVMAARLTKFSGVRS